MINYYRKFYVEFYENSGGYLPFWPILSNVQLGDMILILNGKMIKLGNILDKYFGVYEEVNIQDGWQPYMDSFFIQSGVNQSFSSNMGLKDASISSSHPLLKLDFDFSGDYIFHTPKISTKSIENFYEFKFKLLQTLTSERCSFTEMFVVTSIAKVDFFSLMVARNNEAKAEIVIEERNQANFKFEDLNKEGNKSEISCVQSMASTYLKKNGGELFFKAQKMEASPQGKEIISNYVNAQLPESMRKYKNNILQYTPTQVLPSVDIFPSKVHELFHFREMNMDDLGLFLGGF